MIKTLYSLTKGARSKAILNFVSVANVVTDLQLVVTSFIIKAIIEISIASCLHFLCYGIACKVNV